MAKAFYIGVDGKARKCKKAYIGINNVARKIKKMYIGVAGKARLFFSSGAEVNVSTASVSSLTRAIYPVGSATNDTYAMFVGDNSSGGDAYNSSLTKTHVAEAYPARCGASINNYMVFQRENVLYAFNRSLTRSTVNSSYNFLPKTQLSAGQNSNYAIFAGGTDPSNGNVGSSGGQAYNSSLTQSYFNLSTPVKTDLTCASTTKHVAFDVQNGNVDLIDTTLTLKTCAGVLTSKYCIGGYIGNYTVFAGGLTLADVNTASNKVIFFDDNMTKVAETTMPYKMYEGATATVQNCLLVGGGNTAYPDPTQLSGVYVFDDSLTIVKTLELSVARQFLGAATIGNHILFAGGSNGPIGNLNAGMLDTVDAFICE